MAQDIWWLKEFVI